MKTEEQVRKFRNDLYNSALFIKQSGTDKSNVHELAIVVVRMIDWVLNDDDDMNIGHNVLINLFNQFGIDSMKLS